MGVLLTCQGLNKQFGSTVLFEGVSMTVDDGQRLGLIGPNGAGKSTLLKILCGQDSADSGVVAPRKNLRIGIVPQDPVFAEGLTVGDILTSDNMWFGLAGFRDSSIQISALSGGWKKRLAIALACSQEPELLFLDEPTNHLDLEGILWLERALRQASFSTVLISHDRQFLENTATHVAELNSVYPGGIFRVEGNYSKFLERREQYFEAERRRKEGLEAVVRRELEWLGRKAKARTRKAQARIDSAHALIDELHDMQQRERVSSVDIDFTASLRQTKRLIELERVTKELGGRTLFRDLTFPLVPGMKLGIAGANGAGKSTLLKLLMRQLEPDAGTIRWADQLRTVYFDQQRQQLDPKWTLKRALAPEGDSVLFQGRLIHVNAWASKFLFDPMQLMQPVGRLSGGERARVLIARLMLEPADVLLLDEPTNDLDIPTLGVLEESLEEFPGALVLVTHDRYLLDRLSTHVLGLDGQGGATMYADYSQYESELAAPKVSKDKAKGQAPQPLKPEPSKKKLSYMEQREYDGMEARIQEVEATLAAARARSEAPDVVVNHVLLQEVYAEIEKLEKDLETLYLRWADLETKLIG